MNHLFKAFLPNTNRGAVFQRATSKEAHLLFKEGKKANIEMVVDKERYYFQLQEVDNGTEISSCYSILK